jgi:hypothetical protein
MNGMIGDCWEEWILAGSGPIPVGSTMVRNGKQVMSVGRENPDAVVRGHSRGTQSEFSDEPPGVQYLRASTALGLSSACPTDLRSSPRYKSRQAGTVGRMIG